MADPRTIIVPLTSPGQTATYRLAPGVTQYIQSVVATVDTSASGDVTPVLTISEQSGVVVGDKQQTNAITGGGSGRATWALGLADETLPASGFIRYDFENSGDYLDIATTGVSPVSGEGVQFTVSDTFRVDSHAVQFFPAGAGSADFTVDADNNVTIRAEQQMNLTAFHKPMFLSSSGGSWQAGDFFDMTIGTTGASIVCTGNYAYDLSGGTGSFFIQIPAGSFVEVLDNNGAAIFRVDEAGDLHGKAGKTLTFDL